MNVQCHTLFTEQLLYILCFSVASVQSTDKDQYADIPCDLRDRAKQAEAYDRMTVHRNSPCEYNQQMH